jgi:cytosine/adenosine deaminase-related metal-dependent hydrolase
MMHYTRTQGFTDLPTEAAEVARAARDIGVRVGFAVSMKDRNPLVYGGSEPVLAALPADARAEVERRFLRAPMSPKEQIALVDAVAEAAAGENFDVQYGPNGVQWCSEPLLEAIADASQRTGRRVHMHLLETRYQRAWLDAAYPDGGVRFLDKIGLLSPRLTLAHGVWARPDELELLAERGVTISVNTASNLHLRSGIAPAVQMMRSGCRIALGIDGRALDDDDDALRDLRLAQLLHAGTGFAIGISPIEMLRAAFAAGRFAVTNLADGGGTIAAGAPADLLLLDWAALDDDHLRDDLNPVDLLISRATARSIREVIVAGTTIVKDGRVLGVDHDAARREVLAQTRAGIAANGALAAALPALERAIRDWFEGDHPCC